MAEYIERKVAIKAIQRQYGPNNSVAQNRLLALAVHDVLRVAAADVAQVRHGRWVTHYRSGTTVAEGYVSTCCDMWNNRKSDFCPNCGARIDGAE